MPSQTQLELRGKDPTTLEVILMDALMLNVSRISTTDLVDMFALAVSESIPKQLQRDLANFAKRIENEVADLPDNGQLRDIVIELQDMPAERVTERFRALLARESERETRSKPERVLLGSLVSSFEGNEPEPFPIGAGRPKITKTDHSQQRPSASRTSAPRGTRAGSGRKRSSSAPTRTVNVNTVADPEQTRWLRRTLLERLAGYSESGLSEVVLVAGVKHAARNDYPHMTPKEVTNVLKDLKESGQVRYSAGRWSLPGRW